MNTTTVKPRLLWEIADDISIHWKPVHMFAQPYWNAMRDLETLNDIYLHDSAESVVRYFLSNATTWRGEHARRIKKELNDMLKEHK
jgi:hypothetical protein